MIDNPVKFAIDIANAALSFGAALTLNEWAAILAICWWVYRFADDFYGKWKKGRHKQV
ncbi:hypothetical protein MRBLMC3_000132 [Sphingobium sp. LMC3-1-1.1]|uniref:hypothetical protein n=1 Tax=Sphingobium sp. LMC3-1-1.1 TaxID=3135241 RepID=UPI00342DEE23